MSPEVSAPFGTSVAVNEISCSFTTFSAFGVVSDPDFGCSDRCIVVSHCFDILLLNINVTDNFQ